MNALAVTTGMIPAVVVGLSFAAGLNTYATLLALGVMSRLGWIEIPAGLGAVDDWWMIGVCAFLFAGEFVADKIPGFDVIWNLLHTFIRVPAAAAGIRGGFAAAARDAGSGDGAWRSGRGGGAWVKDGDAGGGDAESGAIFECSVERGGGWGGGGVNVGCRASSGLWNGGGGGDDGGGGGGGMVGGAADPGRVGQTVSGSAAGGIKREPI